MNLPPDLQAAIGEIARIADTCPERYRDVCFRLLLAEYTRQASSGKELPPLDDGWARKVLATIERREKIERRRRPRFRTLKSAALGSVFTLALFIAIEAAVFRSGWYSHFLEPQSSAGMVESYIYWFNRSAPGSTPEAMVIGDSRIAEGFSTSAASESVNKGVRFWNFGIPGSSPRVWYYMLRDIDRQRNRFQSITIALDHYRDYEASDDPENREVDMNFITGRLRLTDCPDLARSVKKQLRNTTFAGCYLKGFLFRKDVAAFLTSFSTRRREAKDWREHGLQYITGYDGKPEALIGLTADFANRKINYPPGLKDWQISSIRSTVTPEYDPYDGRMTRYRSLWLNRILDLYKHSRTRIVFLQLPNAPLPVPEGDLPPPSKYLDSLAGNSHVAILPANTFQDLQAPELFADGLHLNKQGRQIFSQRLAASLTSLPGKR